MDKNEIDELIEKRVTEAKLLVTEKRLQTIIWLAGGLLTVFGVIFPFWLTNRTSDKVDLAVKEMRDEFKELAGQQLRKPVIECFTGGRPLEAAQLFLEPSFSLIKFDIKNSGDASAKNVRLRLYTNFNKEVNIQGDDIWQWRGPSDESAYKEMYDCYQAYSLDPTESKPLQLQLMAENIQEGNYTTLLKIFYEQPEPKRFTFNIKVP